MKKFYFITSVLAITTVIGSAQAKEYTTTNGDTVNIETLPMSDVSGLIDTLNTKANINSVYSKGDIDTKLGTKADASTTYTKDEVDAAVAAKADKATTLAGYGITDAYTKTEADGKFVAKETGKGLSSNDFTDSHKTAIDNLGSMANENTSNYYTKTDANAAFDAIGAAAGVQTAIETKLGAGASGYDIDAKTLKIGGKAAATEEYVDNATTLTTAATSSAGYAANDSVLTAVTKIDGALKTAEDDIAQNKADIAQNKSDIAQNKADIGDMNFTGSNAGSATSLTEAINALDAEIGGALTSTNYIDDTNTINANLSALDDQVKQNADDIATNAANIGSMTFTGNAASETTLTDAINALDGVIGDYSTLSNTNGNLSGTNIVADLDAVDAAIGAAVTGTNGNVVATNSINENLDAIDAAIGDRSTLSATNNNLTAGSTIVEGLNALDATLGDVKNVSNANGNIGGATVAAKLDAIDTNMGDLATLAHGAFGGTTTDITTAMNTLASNVEAATGGTFAADGSWSGSVSVGSSADYTYGTAATNVMEAVNQVATNIGTAVTGTNGNIDAANTVNANLDSLDAAIGDRSAVASLNSAINTAVATDVSTAIETTGNLIGDMNFGSTNYLAGVTNLSDAVRTLDTNIQRVEHKLHNVEYRLKSGLAAMSALSALVPNARDCGNTQISIGTGGYSDRMGIALGGFHYFNDHVLFNAGASYGGTRDWAFRAGITFGI